MEDPKRPPCYVEVKNVTLKRAAGEAHPAEFPDSVTERGAKHLIEITDMVRAGARAVMVYLVQRAECRVFKVAGDIDPTYAKALKTVMAEGVEAVCYGCDVSPDGITIARPLTLDLHS